MNKQKYSERQRESRIVNIIQFLVHNMPKSSLDNVSTQVWSELWKKSQSRVKFRRLKTALAFDAENQKVEIVQDSST